jgi:hypothetical protein
LPENRVLRITFGTSSQDGLRSTSQINGLCIYENMTTKQKCGVAEKLNSCFLEMQLFNFGWKTG